MVIYTTNSFPCVILSGLFEQKVCSPKGNMHVKTTINMFSISVELTSCKQRTIKNVDYFCSVSVEIQHTKNGRTDSNKYYNGHQHSSSAQYTDGFTSFQPFHLIEL